MTIYLEITLYLRKIINIIKLPNMDFLHTCNHIRIGGNIQNGASHGHTISISGMLEKQ